MAAALMPASSAAPGLPLSASALPLLRGRCPSLVPLPHSFDRLIAALAASKCGACRASPQSPVLCLLCGALLCGGSECCRLGADSVYSAFDPHAHRGDAGLRPGGVGEATWHARECGGGVGALLLLSTSQVLLLRHEFAAYYPSPYLDSHGEPDHELRRGRPLYLSQRRYAMLAALLAQHGVGREVARLRNDADRVVRLSYY